ncbi:MAG: hypothetical protein KF708_06475 [Pirellulales bacterium]|nr:hypothetical protein [Pirellulales bacterium]
MTLRLWFLRKIKYLVVIVVLLLPLAWLSQPATVDSSGQRSHRGGYLAQLRDEHRLSQANLGEIDPTGEAIKLATLGLRGVAANILWSKANHYKLTEDWTNFAATLQQISKLQPNYVAVWRYQAWNLSYNVSVEWDDYRDRYFWVIRGIDYLKDGIRYNQDDTRLVYDVGWFVAHKIGLADERKQYRRLFRQDDDFFREEDKIHGERTLAERDNWLVGKEWFLDAQRLVAERNVPILGVSPLVFYSKAASSQMSYATAIEEDGTFGDTARIAWERGGREWRQFGDVDLPTHVGQTIRLNDLERLLALTGKTADELNALQPGLRDQIHEEKLAALTEAERAVLDVPAEQRNFEQEELAAVASRKIDVTVEEIAERVDESNRAKADELVKKINEQAPTMGLISSNRQIVNFEYWRMRCEVEKTSEAIQTRELIHRAQQKVRDTDFEGARADYETAFRHWKTVLDKFPEMRSDGVVGEDMYRVIVRYHELLKQLDEPFPRDFILQEIIEDHEPSSYRGEPGTHPADEVEAAPQEEASGATSAGDPSEQPPVPEEASESAPQP